MKTCKHVPVDKPCVQTKGLICQSVLGTAGNVGDPFTGWALQRVCICMSKSLCYWTTSLFDITGHEVGRITDVNNLSYNYVKRVSPTLGQQMPASQYTGTSNTNH